MYENRNCMILFFQKFNEVLETEIAYTNDKHTLDYYCTDKEKDNASCFMDELILCLPKCFFSMNSVAAFKNAFHM